MARAANNTRAKLAKQDSLGFQRLIEKVRGRPGTLAASQEDVDSLSDNCTAFVVEDEDLFTGEPFREVGSPAPVARLPGEPASFAALRKAPGVMRMSVLKAAPKRA